MFSSFLVHRHKTGKTHFDLRILINNTLRSWSLLREPPTQTGERRLAILREDLTLEELSRPLVDEEAFGAGRVQMWDEGEVEIKELSPRRIRLVFRGRKLSGNYEMALMRWYPGNRWIMRKTAAAGAHDLA